MKSFILDESIDLKETGNYPQCIEMLKGYDYKASDSIYEISENRDRMINKKLNLDGILMRKASKATDVLSVTMAGGRGFFINEKFKELLIQFNLCDHEFHEAKIIHKEKEYVYFWLHLACDWLKFVDYPKSKFNLGYENIKLESYDDYLKYVKEYDTYRQLKSSRVKMLPTFDKTLDMFYISRFSVDIVISNKLKSAILDNKITGVEIKENKKIIIV